MVFCFLSRASLAIKVAAAALLTFPIAIAGQNPNDTLPLEYYTAPSIETNADGGIALLVPEA